MRLPKDNSCRISGNVATVDIKNGQHGPFGTIGIIVDDGYFKKEQNNSQTWMERSYFISIKISSKIVKQCKGQIGKGDFFSVDGKIVTDKWNDRNSGKEMQATKIEARNIVMHLDASLAKSLRQQSKQHNDQQNTNGQYQSNGQQFEQNQNFNQQPQQNQGHYQPQEQYQNQQQPQRQNFNNQYQQ